jgi:hypothetical protein
VSKRWKNANSEQITISGRNCTWTWGEVLVLAPFVAESSCAFPDESADIAALFQAAGYRVTFKCNDHVVCPSGPLSLDDYTGWSKYAFVAVSTVGDADASGESPIILARAPTDFSAERMQDWQAGRMLLTGDGLFALRWACCICMSARLCAFGLWCRSSSGCSVAAAHTARTQSFSHAAASTEQYQRHQRCAMLPLRRPCYAAAAAAVTPASASCK